MRIYEMIAYNYGGYYTKPKHTWVLQDTISKSLGLNYALSPNIHGYDKTLDPNLLGLTTC
jgi:hypothetical protein